MSLIRNSIVCLAFVATMGIEFSRAAAQDNPPIVDSEVIGGQPFRSALKPLLDPTADQSSDPTPAHAQAKPAQPSIPSLIARTPAPALANEPRLQSRALQSIMNSKPAATVSTVRPQTPASTWSAVFGPLAGDWIAGKLAAQMMPPHLNIPAMSVCPSAADVLGKLPPSLATSLPAPPQINENSQPTPLSSSDSQLFRSSTAPPLANSANENWQSARPAASNVSRMPKMSKMFSFDTIDKVAANQVAPAIAAASPEVTLNLAGPDAVAVNQVFQQLVQVRNSSNIPLRDVRVTQVCDLDVLGADRPQAVTIEILAPGETKTVRFSARAKQPGPFALKYVAQNAEMQADVDELVNVREAALGLQVNAPTMMQAGDGGDISIAIHNPSLTEWSDLCVRCKSPASAELKTLEPTAAIDPRDGSMMFRLAKLNPQTTETVRLRIVPMDAGPLRLEFSVESATGIVTCQALEISVVSPPR